MRHDTLGSKAGATTLIHYFFILKMKVIRMERQRGGICVARVSREASYLCGRYLLRLFDMEALIRTAQLNDTNLLGLQDSACF